MFILFSAALAPLSPSPEQTESMTDRDVTMRSENASPQRQTEDQQTQRESENTEVVCSTH